MYIYKYMYIYEHICLYAYADTYPYTYIHIYMYISTFIDTLLSNEESPARKIIEAAIGFSFLNEVSSDSRSFILWP
jgi:hypothetical protein